MFNAQCSPSGGLGGRSLIQNDAHARAEVLDGRFGACLDLEGLGIILSVCLCGLPDGVCAHVVDLENLHLHVLEAQCGDIDTDDLAQWQVFEHLLANTEGHPHVVHLG